MVGITKALPSIVTFAGGACGSISSATSIWPVSRLALCNVARSPWRDEFVHPFRRTLEHALADAEEPLRLHIEPHRRHDGIECLGIGQIDARTWPIFSPWKVTSAPGVRPRTEPGK